MNYDCDSKAIFAVLLLYCKRLAMLFCFKSAFENSTLGGVCVDLSSILRAEIASEDCVPQNALPCSNRGWYEFQSKLTAPKCAPSFVSVKCLETQEMGTLSPNSTAYNATLDGSLSYPSITFFFRERRQG
jgi:hypothetical protein